MGLSTPCHYRPQKEIWIRWIDAIASGCVLGGIIWGAMLRFNLPSTPLSDPDVWGYLNPALGWLSGLGFQQTAGRDWLYPAILAGILKLGGDFSWITYVQHILGLLAAWAMWLTYWLWLRFFFDQTVLFRIIEILIGLGGIFLYVLSSNEIRLEASIRPEGIVSVFGLSYLFCVIAYFSARWRYGSTWKSIVYGAGSLLLSYIVFLLKPSWGFALFFTVLIVMAGTFGKGKLTARFGPLLTGLGLIGLLVVTPHLLSFQKDDFSQTFLPLTLVSIHAEQIAANARKTTNQNLHPGYQATTADLFYQSLEQAIIESKKNTGGFDPDYIMYRSNVFQEVTNRQHWNSSQLASFCYSIYLKTWLGSPLEMLDKICRQWSRFLFPKPGDFYSSVKGLNLSREFLYSLKSLPSVDPKFSPSIQTLYHSYLERLNYRPENDRASGGRAIFRVLARLIAKLSLAVQLAFFGALILTWLSRKASQLRLPGLAVLAAAMAAYGNVLTIAVVHTLDVARYRMTYSPIYLLVLSMMLTFLLVSATKLFSRGSLGHSEQNSGEDSFYPRKSART